MVNDPRDPRENTCRVVTNFDVLTDPYRMVPYRSSEAGDSAPTTSVKRNFAIGLWTPSTPDEYRLFALGKQAASPTRAEILMKMLSTGADTDLDDDDWATPAVNQASQNNTSYNLFVYYAKTGKFYGAHTGTHIWAFTPDGSTGFADTHRAITYTNIAQGLVHSKDDILYIPYDNKIAKNDNGSWSDAILTLPSHLYITSIAERGNYLAIACAPLSGIGHSVVYIWDRDSSLETLSDSIDWGEETLKVIEEINGILVGVSLSGANSTRFNDRVIFRYVLGSTAVKFAEFLGTSVQLPIAKQKINNRLYFMMSLVMNGATREGVWSVGQTGENFSIVHERTSNNDIATNINLYNFFLLGDFLFNSHVDGATENLSKTNDQATYSATSIYESKIFNNGDSSLKKKLVGVTVTTEPLPTAGQIVLKYKINAESSYTTIFTETTDNSISHSAINIESSGNNLPEYNEIQFRIESTGGAVITGLSFEAEVTGKRLY